ncbi:hypothetical protein [Cohnella fermenti]|uniref:Uncharacterized protein n=1 Tax=Cohnella fermenti TaxID=2565925 RepID=A0A4V3WEP3_9BACL|nr:hypothetical protein [Cohnella fermenti]THF77134.1 hypothetical protein E6C55_17375 [Cohnella fermenti]
MATRRKFAVPAARSGQWAIWGACEFALFAVLLLAIRFGVLGQAFRFVHAFRFVLLAAALSLVAALAGWLGARLLWLAFTAGTLAGLLAMLVYSRKEAGGWEDLIGILAFMELAAIGFAVGLVAELAAWLLRRRRRAGGG